MIFIKNLKFCLHLVLTKIRPKLIMIDVARNKDVFLDCKKAIFKVQEVSLFQGG